MWDLTLAHTGAFGLFFPSPLSLGALPAEHRCPAGPVPCLPDLCRHWRQLWAAQLALSDCSGAALSPW